MKKKEGLVYWIVVWTIFLFVLLLMLEAGLVKVFGTNADEPLGINGSVLDSPNFDCVFLTTESIVQLEIPQISRTYVDDEVRVGKDLYLFYISQIHEQYYPDVDPYIVQAVMETESNYNPNAYNKSGATGLMQVLPKYHLRRAYKYGLNDIWDPYTNIIVGVDLLNDLYHSYGDWNRALLGYNNSVYYVNHVLALADTLRGGGQFG